MNDGNHDTQELQCILRESERERGEQRKGEGSGRESKGKRWKERKKEPKKEKKFKDPDSWFSLGNAP